MNFRTKVLLSTTSTVAIAVWIVAWFASAAISQSFEARDRQRVGALVDLLRTELAHRGEDVARRVEAIANSQALARIAAALHLAKILSDCPFPNRCYNSLIFIRSRRPLGGTKRSLLKKINV